MIMYFFFLRPMSFLFIQTQVQNPHSFWNALDPVLQSPDWSHDKRSYLYVPFFYQLKEFVYNIFLALGMQYFILRHNITVQDITFIILSWK